MTPSVCRIVHYVSYGTPRGEYGKECRAAIITVTGPEPDTTVGLAVFNPTGMFFNQAVPFHDADGQHGGPLSHLCGGRDLPPGTWHWPGRTP